MDFPKNHDDIFKWKHFPRCWPFVRGMNRLPVDFPHIGQWRGALMTFFYLRLIKRLSKQSRRHRAHCDVTVMPGFSRVVTTHRGCTYASVNLFMKFVRVRHQDITRAKCDVFRVESLTHFPPEKNMTAISQTILSDAFVDNKLCILIKISLKFVPKGSFDNNPVLV